MPQLQVTGSDQIFVQNSINTYKCRGRLVSLEQQPLTQTPATHLDNP